MNPSNEDKKLCRFCGSEMKSGFVFCKECSHFNNWRRHFTISTTVLSLLVALFSVLGLNLLAMLDFAFPDRASFAVSSLVVSPTEIKLIAANIGGELGYLGSSIDCSPTNPDGNYLSFRVGAIEPIAPGAKAETIYHPASIYWMKYFEALNSDHLDHIPTDGYGYQSLNEELGGDWQCSMKAYDKFGEIPTPIPDRSPRFFLRYGEFGGQF